MLAAEAARCTRKNFHPALRPRESLRAAHPKACERPSSLGTDHEKIFFAPSK